MNATYKPILSAALGLAFIAGVAAPAHAETCETRIHRAEVNLEKAERRHGKHSAQANKRRHQLEEAREHCRLRP